MKHLLTLLFVANGLLLYGQQIYISQVEDEKYFVEFYSVEDLQKEMVIVYGKTVKTELKGRVGKLIYKDENKEEKEAEFKITEDDKLKISLEPNELKAIDDFTLQLNDVKLEVISSPPKVTFIAKPLTLQLDKEFEPKSGKEVVFEIQKDLKNPTDIEWTKYKVEFKKGGDIISTPIYQRACPHFIYLEKSETIKDITSYELFINDKKVKGQKEDTAAETIILESLNLKYPEVKVKTRFDTTLLADTSNNFRIKKLKDDEVILVYDFYKKMQGWYIVQCKNSEDDIDIKPLNSNTEKLLSKKNLSIRVVNVNRHVFNVDLLSEGHTNTTPMPLLFKNFAYPDSNSTWISNLSSKISFLKTVKEQQTEEATAQASKTTYYDEYYQQLYDFYIYLTYIQAELIKSQDPYGATIYNPKVTEIVFQEASEAALIIRHNGGLLQNDLIKKATIKATIEAQLNENKLLKKYLADKNKYEEEKKSIEAKKGETKVVKTKIEEIEKLINKLKVKTVLGNDEQKKLQNKLDSLNNDLKHQEALATLIGSLPTQEELLNYQMALNLQGNNEYRRTNIQLRNIDFLELKVGIEARDEFPQHAQFNIEENSRKLIVKNSNRFSFSQGFFAGGLSQPNFTYKWHAVTDGGNTKFQLFQSGYEPSPFGVVALANYSFFDWLSFSSGPAVSVEEEPQFHFILGLSLTLSDNKSRLIHLSCGANIYQSQQISPYWKGIYDNNTLFDTAPIDNIYYDEIRASLSFALTYTFFKKQRTK
ncbi:coiled-coil domain-containing protein [Carboxylicivirga linearis]|uniref:Cullin family profile domain-containing protein n=1 Tax=Carboxylicivirga linearis TaxID=1628157 RepID=A0ABS5JWD4_9BACT|nr:hypothetical protein [Carboxylicivirga linearis]MBS2099139.1 hypothetical protein [Carboxylicivirga linearis]